MSSSIDDTLQRLAELIREGRFEEQETDTLELKPVPPTGGDWRERAKSVNAFLNTRGGILVLGITERGQGAERRYEFSGWRAEAEGQAKELCRKFTTREGSALDLSDHVPRIEPRAFLDGQVALIYVDELPADEKYVFYNGEAYRRLGTGDLKMAEHDIATQEDYREEARNARELLVEPGTSVGSFDLDKLNDYISRLNRPVKVETLKPSLEDALAFLERKHFLKGGQATLLGLLVCGDHPADRLNFRCHVHGYVDTPAKVADDKQDFIDNVLPLMESAYSYVLRNIQVGVGVDRGGTATPQYPVELVRETVNNALAHRDYKIDRQVIVVIRPGLDVAITNPGTLPRRLLLEAPDEPIPIRRIIPEAKPRNPKLADVLRVYRKWEGRSIGMSTLVNLCLENRIDLPYYRLGLDEVRLVLRPGKLVGDRMERHFGSYDRYLSQRLRGRTIEMSHKLLLAYLIKSEWENVLARHTIQLTPDNNHFGEIRSLEEAGLISKHPSGTANYPIYVADRILVARDFITQVGEFFGPGFDSLNEVERHILSVVYRYNNYCTSPHASAKQVSFSLWYDRHPHGNGDIREFDSHYRSIRHFFNKLQKQGFVEKHSRGYALNAEYRSSRLF